MLSRVRNTPELRSYFNSLDRDTKARSFQFDYLWTIFPPGEVVYSTVFLREPQLFIVKGGYESSDSERDKKRVWKLICWSYDWNGRTFNRVPVKFCFEEFQGFRATETLVAYPLKIMPKESIDKLVFQLRRRGERFRDLCTKKRGEQMFDYEGETITHGAGFQKLGNRRNGRQVRWLVVIQHLRDSSENLATTTCLKEPKGPFRSRL
ncbi:hypothetical protein J3458_020888 [Metarhizium acridum]|uniref:uncharacterized protein n=1 Tax=Metarhizium acridum TaxID=92637 RepID=UPI001C6C958F|nr:hypothetical protein J3458_020888 [Metarhizium acridum]